MLDGRQAELVDVLWLQWLAAEAGPTAEERRGRLVELTKALVQEHLVRELKEPGPSEVSSQGTLPVCRGCIEGEGRRLGQVLVRVQAVQGAELAVDHLDTRSHLSTPRAHVAPPATLAKVAACKPW